MPHDSRGDCFRLGEDPNDPLIFLPIYLLSTLTETTVYLKFLPYLLSKSLFRHLTL